MSLAEQLSSSLAGVGPRSGIPGFSIPSVMDSAFNSNAMEISAVPPFNESANPNHIGGTGTQVTPEYVLSYTDSDRTLLRQRQVVFVEKGISANTGPDRGTYVIKNLESMNRLLRNKFEKATRLMEGPKIAGLRELLDVNERHWRTHSVFQGIQASHERMEVLTYLTRVGIMDAWAFLGSYLMDEGLNKEAGGALTGTNMNIPVLVKGKEDIEDVWGSRAVAGAELFFILKRKMAGGNTRGAGPFQFVPYVKAASDAVIPDNDLIYYDTAGQKQYGQQIYVGRVVEVPDRRHTDEDVRLVEAGLALPTSGAAVDRYASVRRLTVNLASGDKLWKTREDWFF